MTRPFRLIVLQTARTAASRRKGVVMMRYSIAISAVLAVVTLGLPPAFSQVLLRAGHISPKESVEGMAIDRFADLVKQKTHGAVTVQVFPSEQLGKAPTQIESVIIGNQDIYFGGTPEFERFSDGLKLLGVNWAIPSEEAFRKITKDPIWKEILLDPLDKQGLTVLASNWERGPYRVMVSTKPINSIADMKGLKFRIAPIDTWRRSWAAVGMENVVLAFTDVYLGLRQGTVEAVTSPISLVAPMKFTEVAKYIVRTDEFWQILVPAINKDRLAKLTPDQQRALFSAAEEAGAWFVTEQERLSSQDIEKMKKEQGASYKTLDLQPGVEMMKPVIKQMESEGTFPKGLYDRVQKVAAAP
jgi:tripartite ATP-independent transporter DctP family solute receptor